MWGGGNARAHSTAGDHNHVVVSRLLQMATCRRRNRVVNPLEAGSDPVKPGAADVMRRLTCAEPPKKSTSHVGGYFLNGLLRCVAYLRDMTSE